MQSNGRIISLALLVMTTLVGGAGCSSAEDESAADAQRVSSSGRSTTKIFERRERLDLDQDGIHFLRTRLEPKSGKISTAHPDKYELDGSKVWALHSASEERETQCGTIERDADGASFSGECEFAGYYELSKTEVRVYEHRERIDMTRDGFTRTLLDPSTGRILTAHPEKFVVEGDTVFSANHATGEKEEKCGTFVIRDTSAEFEGCGLWASYDLAD